ncbi:MAG: hypothetical protein BWZ03_00219 [bacterium ADurb.BinA186]|nr:MAG: hypothetical protein BWZ03_00219 [bacterium ADurb.BinA186]
MKVEVKETKIVEVRYDATYNRGNYESEKIGATAQVGDNEDPADVLAKLKDLCSGKAPARAEKSIVKEDPVETTEAAQETTVDKPKRSKKAKETPAPQPQEEAEEAVEEKAAPAPKKKSKATPYNRANDLHKKLVGQFLDSIQKGWRDDSAVKARCGQASVDLNGTDFLDEEGVIIESFKEAFKKNLEESAP